MVRIVDIEYPEGRDQTMSCWQEPVEVGPGQTVEVRIGGKGRPVIGRIVLDGTPAVPIDWTQNEPVVIGAARRCRARNNRLHSIRAGLDSPPRSTRTAGSVSRMSPLAIHA